MTQMDVFQSTVGQHKYFSSILDPNLDSVLPGQGHYLIINEHIVENSP